MLPIQLLTNNLLYDFSQVPIPTDNVGSQQTAKPRPWNMGEIAKFILFIGPISSIFRLYDLLSDVVLLQVLQRRSGAPSELGTLFRRCHQIQTMATQRRSFIRGGLWNR